MQKRSLQMNKQIWYGTNGNNVAFAENKVALTEAGISNPQSFTVNGEVTGLDLIGGSNNDGNLSNTAQSGGAPQTA
jgi:hypothetical protein